MTTELLWDRDGHLHELGVHRLLAGELGGAALEVGRHLEGCAVCQARRDAVQAIAAEPLPELKFPARSGLAQAPRRAGAEGVAAQASAPVAAPLAAPVAAPLAARRPIRRWGAVGGVAALLLGGLLWSQVPEPGEFTARGGGLRLEVWREEQGKARRLQDGDGVQAGDRLGFRVASEAPGELIVAGVDGTGAVYPVWPPGGSGSAPVTASKEAQQLDAAIQLDSTPGAERIVALRCGEPVGWGWLSGALKAEAGAERLPALKEGCVQEEVRLQKR